MVGGVHELTAGAGALVMQKTPHKVAAAEGLDGASPSKSRPPSQQVGVRREEEGERERQRDRGEERERQRDRGTERERDRGAERERERERHRTHLSAALSAGGKDERDQGAREGGGRGAR